MSLTLTLPGHSNVTELVIDRYEIPGVFLNQHALDLEGAARLPMMPSDVPGLNLYFVVTMEPVPGKETLNCGLEIQACVNTSVVQNDLVKKLHGEEMCIIKKPIFNNTEIPVPKCESHNKYPAEVLVGEVCNVAETGQCGDHMTCTQVRKKKFKNASDIQSRCCRRVRTVRWGSASV